MIRMCTRIPERHEPFGGGYTGEEGTNMKIIAKSSLIAALAALAACGSQEGTDATTGAEGGTENAATQAPPPADKAGGGAWVCGRQLSRALKGAARRSLQLCPTTAGWLEAGA